MNEDEINGESAGSSDDEDGFGEGNLPDDEPIDFGEDE